MSAVLTPPPPAPPASPPPRPLSDVSASGWRRVKSGLASGFMALSILIALVPLVLIAVQALVGPQWALLATHPRLFLSACIAYLTAGLLLILARRFDWSSLRVVVLVNSGVDAAAIALILYASGGVASGLGILLVLPVAGMAVLADVIGSRPSYADADHR